MFALERQNKIEGVLKQKSSIKVNELAAMFDVSESTIRRDLHEMEDRGLIRRTHGGAMDSTSTSFEPSFKDKQDERHDDKALIGEAAAAMVEDGDTIILDTGTTTMEIAKRLTAKNLTVITNSIDIAMELSHKESIEIILTGGSLRCTTRAMVGSITEKVISNFRVDKAFIGTNGISIKDGVTTPNFTEAQIKRAMINIAKKVIIVADSSKFNKVCFSLISPISCVSSIVTAGALDNELIKEYKDHEIDVIVN